MKKVITESQLRRIVKESVRRVMNEISTELAGAAAIKANRMANDGRLSPYERTRKLRQADSLYSGAKDRFRDEHSYEQDGDPSIQNFRTDGDMPSIFGYVLDKDKINLTYPHKGLEYSKRIRYNSKGAIAKDFDKSDGGCSEYLNNGTFYDSMSNRNLKRADKAEKDFDGLRKKAQDYNRQLNATEE